MIKILVVDDSAFMRKVLSDLFKSQPDFEVVDIGRNGAEAVEKVKQHSPDVVTLDVEMPVMDGLTALEQIMSVKPTPVVMVSSLTKAGADLLQKCREAAGVSGSRLRVGTVPIITPVKLPERTPAVVPEKVSVSERTLGIDRLAPSVAKTTAISGVDDWIVAIGTSTGGPRALQEVLTRLPGSLPCPTVVVQHMPPGFTKSLAERLNSLSELTVKEAADNDKLAAGTVYIAPGDFHLTLRRDASGTYVKLNKDPAIGGLRPAVDPMMISVAETYGTKTVGVILTGMGHDGAKGMQAIKRLHGRTIAEDQSTSVVFGMPKAAIEAGAVDTVLPLPQVAEGIVQCLKKGGLK